jgi:hypothetical protein
MRLPKIAILSWLYLILIQKGFDLMTGEKQTQFFAQKCLADTLQYHLLKLINYSYF